MCECGCAHVRWEGKVIDTEGHAWLFGVHASCSDCQAPAGLLYWRVPPKEFEDWDIDHIPELKVDAHDRMGFMAVLSIGAVRGAMEKAIDGYQPSGGIMDAVDAEVLSEEAFRDLRHVVSETKAQERRMLKETAQ